eukprot:RCo029284
MECLSLPLPVVLIAILEGHLAPTVGPAVSVPNPGEHIPVGVRQLSGALTAVSLPLTLVPGAVAVHDDPPSSPLAIPPPSRVAVPIGVLAGPQPVHSLVVAPLAAEHVTRGEYGEAARPAALVVLPLPRKGELRAAQLPVAAPYVLMPIPVVHRAVSVLHRAFAVTDIGLPLAVIHGLVRVRQDSAAVPDVIVPVAVVPVPVVVQHLPFTVPKICLPGPVVHIPVGVDQLALPIAEVVLERALVDLARVIGAPPLALLVLQLQRQLPSVFIAVGKAVSPFSLLMLVLLPGPRENQSIGEVEFPGAIPLIVHPGARVHHPVSVLVRALAVAAIL